MKTKQESYRVGHAGYVSEFDQFIDKFMRQHPEVGEDQMNGWYIWWDHKLDLDELEQQHKDEVPVKPYQYE